MTMAKPSKPDRQFEIEFFEAVHRRCPDYQDVVGLLGGLYTKAGRITDGLRMDRKLVRLDPANPTAHYNLACSLALCRKRPDALRSLRKALSLGYDDLDWMQQDPDLEILKNDPEFQQLLRQLKPQS
jgi:tetratricopeptide (TPR) repeat protein